MLGATIGRLRRKEGLTQEQLAQKLDVTNQAVSKWETDQCCPDVAMLPKLADIFSVTIDALFGRETQKAENPEFPWDNDDALHIVAYAGHRLIGVAELADQEHTFCYEGPARDIQSYCSISCGAVGGNVSAGTYVECGAVAGNVTAGEYIECGDVIGRVAAGNYAECGDVTGDIAAGSYVECGNVGGSVDAVGYVECGDVGGNVDADQYIECGDVGGNVVADQYVECGDVSGDVDARQYVECGDVGGSINAAERAEREKGSVVIEIKDKETGTHFKWNPFKK